MLFALTTTGRAIASAVTIGVAFALTLLGRVLAARRRDDPASRYQLRRVVHYSVLLGTVVALLLVWRAFHGQTSLVVGLTLAGAAFALQEVIGAIAGWFNILSGRIYRIGDRIEIGGVQGDVIDVTLLRTKLLEMGSQIETPADS